MGTAGVMGIELLTLEAVLGSRLLEARVEIGRLKRRFCTKSAIFRALQKPTVPLPELTPSLHLC